VAFALEDGQLLDQKYRIVRFIGRGAWASVYEGVNARIGRRVAIKVLSDEAIVKPGIVDRFEREAQAATRIESDHVVHVFDLGVLPDGRPYIVMELLEGESLGQHLQSRGALTQGRAVFYAVQALRGLGDAHAAGVTHRDIKPDNMVLVKNKHGDEILKIVDFGISKLQSGLQVSSMTQTNTILGSPVYMSPEQCRGTRHMDHRSDLYSLGVVLFELLTGHLPHKGESINELMFKIALEDTISPAELKPDLDPELCAIVLTALAREITERFQTAEEFEQSLIDWAGRNGIDTEGFASRRSRFSMGDEPETVTVNSSQRRGAVPRPIELAETKHPARMGSGAAVVRLESDTGDAQSSTKSSGETKVSATSPTGPASSSELTGASTTGAIAMEAGKSVEATTGDVQQLPKKRGWIWAAGLAGCLLVGGIAFLSKARAIDGPTKTTAVSTASTAVIAAPPPEASAPLPAAASSTPVAATNTADTTDSAPDAQPSASAHPSRFQVGTVPRRTTTTAATPATAASSAAPSAAVAPAAPSGSAKPVVDGRRFRTDF
jgi:serine/threonine-protein kinase